MTRYSGRPPSSFERGTDADLPAADDDQDERALSGMVASLLFAGIWLIFLASPLVTAWRMPNHLRGAAGVGATVAFGLSYLWHLHEARTGRLLTLEACIRPRLYGYYALMVIFAAATTVLVGQEGAATWVFLAVAGIWSMRLAVGFGIGLGLVVLYEVLAWQLPGWQRDDSLAGSILLAMLAVTGAMVAGRRQRALHDVRRENARLAVQDERNRMARDLHDILGHSLTVITVKAELAGRLMDADPQRARAEVADLERLSRDALSDVRRAVEGYREISLAGELVRARRSLAAAGIEAELPLATDEVSSDLRELFAWTVREAVTNVIRHSHARHVTITLTQTEVTIRDDGSGRTGEGPAGNGLSGLRERAAAAGAILTTRQDGGSGFTVVVGAPTTHAGDARAADTARPATPVATPRTI